MKNKLSKIILSACSLSTTAIVPFFLVACNANWVEPIVMHDIYKNGQPVYEPDPGFVPLHDTSALSQQQVIDLYLNACTNDPNLFQNDMLMIASVSVAPFINSVANFPMVDCSFGFSQPTFGKTYIWEWGFDKVEYNTISFTQKISASFQSGSKEQHEINIETIDITVSYNNVLFNIYEDLNYLEHGSASAGWHIGLLDETLESESFWPYSRNENPWSINYDCTYRCKRIMYFQEDYDPIEINNCYYFTGIIDDVREIMNFYSTIHESSKSLIDTGAASIALLLPYKSYYLSELSSLPDVGLASRLHAVTNAGEEWSAIQGLKLISTNKDVLTKDSVWIVSDEPIVFKEIDGEHSLHLPGKKVGDEVLTKVTLDSDDISLWIRADIEPSPYPTSGTSTFTIPMSTFKIRIVLSDTSTIESIVRLHYNSLVFEIQ